jgi:hypothetical protein
MSSRQSYQQPLYDPHPSMSRYSTQDRPDRASFDQLHNRHDSYSHGRLDLYASHNPGKVGSPPQDHEGLHQHEHEQGQEEMEEEDFDVRADFDGRGPRWSAMYGAEDAKR